jgi:hypothetical protein
MTRAQIKEAWRMKRPIAPKLALALCTSLLCLATLAPAAAAAQPEITEFTTSASTTAAGGHPDLSTHIALDVDPPNSGHRMRSLRIALPPGVIANPTVVAPCPLAYATNGPEMLKNCPVESQVGVASVRVISPESEPSLGAIFVTEKAPDRPAQLYVAFSNGAIPLVPVTVDLRTDSDFGVDTVTPEVNNAATVFELDITVWGVPNSHERGGVPIGFFDQSPLLPPDFPSEWKAFTTNPTVCDGPKTTTLEVTFQGTPEVVHRLTSEDPAPTECDQVPFDPQLEIEPTSRRADSPSGLDVALELPQHPLLSESDRGTSHLKDTVVKLPVGVSVNPAAADGLASCTEAQMGLLGTGFPGYHPIRFDKSAPSCPDAAKIGSLGIDTPLIGENTPGEQDLRGSVYLAAQSANPFGSLYAIYLVAQGHGVTVKLAGEVTADPVTGRIETTFLNNPQVPFSRLELHFKDGPRAPLATPSTCGIYESENLLTPWSDPDDPVEISASMTIDQDPGGGACQAGNPSQPGNAADAAARPLAPTLSAGLVSNLAGKSSPFALRLTRPDGDQEISSLGVDLPPGLTAKLAGLGRCSDATLAAISALPGQGAAENANPSCPADSQVGVATIGAGAGPSPLFVHTGRAYLAGPYMGAPLSLAAVVPAVAGPFDLGTTVVRNRLLIDPDDAQVHVESDPFPTILSGIPIRLRDIRVNVNRPDFMQAPTNCEPMAVGARAHGVDGAIGSASDRFQVDGCRRLGFKPRLRLRLFGGTRRTDYPRLRAILTARKGDANIGRASVRLPHSAFLAQEHIRTVCTRVQFAADACPPGSVYGRASAVTPLLDVPLRGPVYLRSSDNPLPDLVAALRGPDWLPIEIELAGRTDSVRGGLRNTFDLVPDAPVTKFTLELFGGKKGLVVNSENLCERKQRATVRLTAQSGRRLVRRPLVRNSCRSKAAKKAR